MIKFDKKINDSLKIFFTLLKKFPSSNKNITIQVKDGFATFIQENTECILYTKVKVESLEEFIVSWDSFKFLSLVNRINDDISIDSKHLYTKTGKFYLENCKINNKILLYLKDLVVKPNKIISFDNYEGLLVASNFISKTDIRLSYVSIKGNDIFATNRDIVYRDTINSSNSNLLGDKALFLHPDIIKVIPFFNKVGNEETKYKCEIQLFDNLSFWSLYVKELNLSIFLTYKSFVMPDMDSDKYKKGYLHDEYFIIDEVEFYSKFNVMMILAVDNPNNRLFADKW